MGEIPYIGQTEGPFQITLDIPRDRVKDILTTAMETSCYYWTRVVDEPKHPFCLDIFDKFFLNNVGWIKFGILDNSGELTPERHLLTWDNVAKGFEIMAEKYPHHFGDFITENDDATTADVFLQCCLLGEIVYR